ncbi:methylmalonyl Co-A mutase-associated GTPase MeaB [Levilinea saccharolytica]|uniref:LAO/AO transport system ATPase n=1 Tax=Levilinea saccharolytica TaxID=229921 RepID=A0A0M8JQ98_9CHLR|nr:methylmalonyl Co-A mutase-associated GTPase MeaB [Levilinea saccharolytica]KPL87489.1 hypothetical protein ADN01_04920 [Levilinea saccharolytica]GAP19651.1 LAO/AO transport system ATPase [Levilinea saccharolytica]
MSLVEALLAGERLALARLLSQVENDTPAGRAGLDALYAHTGRAHLVGITGSPGTGKSSLVNQLALALRRPPEGTPPLRVAIVAVDPSSPFSGGALLGDRVRMRDLSGDPGVFIRSMASRGALGGLARATAAAVQVLDAAGFDMILIETVGAGQSEVDIARLAHTTLVVEAPGLGDDIQAIKAGILEIADILVVNKADLPGADNTERALRMMLELANPGRDPHEHQGWRVPVLRTVAAQAQGIPEVIAAVQQHAQHLRSSGEWHSRDRARLTHELEDRLRSTLAEEFHRRLPAADYEAAVEALLQRQLSPSQAVEKLLRQADPARSPQSGSSNG